MVDESQYDVCIVGAGITGLNALEVASGYLGPGARVALVDGRERPGGMWVDTYDYVRLHQPHGIFTAGNIPWTLGFDRAHLASKAEVLDHLAHCLDVTRQKVTVDERFGWHYLSHTEDGGGVRAVVRSPEGAEHTVWAKRLIKAFGHQVVPNRPLALTSSQVQSLTPEMLDPWGPQGGAAEPVWIVGGGKTAMDTAYTLLTANPRREVNLIAGPGTTFSRRDTFFPTGARRWWSGTRINAAMREVALRFDGTNAPEVNDWFRTTYGVAPITPTGDYFFAYLSDREAEVISRGLSTVEHDYLEDVRDVAGRVELVLRSGARREVAPGSWVVNCTGSLLRTPPPYERFVSDSGNVLSIQMRSSTTGVFPPFAGYFLTHLMFRDMLGSTGLYELDVAELAARDRPSVAFASMTLTVYNIGKFMAVLPSSVLNGCGLDYDRWYPAHRRLIGAAASLRHARADGRQLRRTLDRIGETHGVRCQPVRIGTPLRRRGSARKAAS